MGRMLKSKLYAMLDKDVDNFKIMYHDPAHTLVTIAKCYHCDANPDHIRDYATSLGYIPKTKQLSNSRKAVKIEIINNLERLYIDELWSLSRITTHYGVTNDFMSKILKETKILKSPKLVAATAKKTFIQEYGVDNAFKCDKSVTSKKKRCLKDKIDKVELSRLYKKHGTAWVANHYNISASYVDKIRAEYNIPTRPACKSAEETTIYNFIVENTQDLVKSSDRTVLGGKEIDILINSAGVGFEYNGIFWHNAEICDEYFHIRKSLVSLQNQVSLYHIFSDSFNHKKETVYNFILDKINKPLVLTAPIDTTCCEISDSTFLEFYKDNAISILDDNDNKCYGMFINNELVYVGRYGNNTITDFIAKLHNKYNPLSLINFIIQKNLPKSLYLKIDISENPNFELDGFDYYYTQLPNKLFFKNDGSNVLKYTQDDNDLCVWNAGYKIMKYKCY